METVDKHILKVSNLTVELPNQTVLENVSFAFEKGKTLAIIGPNGAGKTMLFRALLVVIAGVAIFATTVLIRWKKRISV